MKVNEKSLDTLCAALCYTMGVEPPQESHPANEILTKYVDEKFGGEKADRIFMYNPDAIGQWIYEKYPALFESAELYSDIKIPLRSTPRLLRATLPSMRDLLTRWDKNTPLDLW